MLIIEDTVTPENVEDASPALKNSESAQILIVDDEADIRFALTRILRLEGYLADQAKSGVEALNLLTNKEYDVMVLDMRLPGMDGLEIMRYVQEMQRNLLIIILTGQATLESAIAATKSDNVVDYLLKPVSNDEFVTAIASALQKRVERLCHQQLLTAAAQMLNAMQSPGIVSDTPAVIETTISPTNHLLHASPLTLDRQKRLVTMIDDPTQVVELTKGEAVILAWLMLHPNRVISCQELVVNALGYKTTTEEAESVIRPYIFRLRRKIEPTPQKPRLISTVRRKGYCFNILAE